VRVLIFHGYLLQGTGSNVYNANLAAALVRLGHEVHLLCQDRAPEGLPFVDAVADWDGGQLTVRVLREPVRCTVYRPALAGLLPVYVVDRYEGIEARAFPDCSDGEIAAYVNANVRAVREVAERVWPQVALANHLIMGPLVLARGLRDVPYAVKVHGSELEYTIAPHPERFLPAAREGSAPACTLLVGSGHIARRLQQTLGDPSVLERTRLGPPGVDVARFAPRESVPARAGLGELAERLARAAAEAGGAGPVGEERSAFARDAGEAAAALADVVRGTEAGRAGANATPDADRLVAFVGKLIVSKGIDLLVAAWPLVLQRVPRARLVVIGFGAYRDGVERLIAALADGPDGVDALEALVAAGRGAEGGPVALLRHLRDFFDGLADDDLAHYRAAARGLRERIVLTGRLDHDELADLLPACEALVVPSTFPEAFGMVAAEGAACGALPICSDHSGLAEVAGALADAVPPPARDWLAFPVDPGEGVGSAAGARPTGPVRAIAERIVAWLEAPAELREATREALVATVRERWSWEGVARTVIAAAGTSAGAPDAPPERTGR
jgi:glycosyltransferase involved in cell wall biosynthesis